MTEFLFAKKPNSSNEKSNISVFQNFDMTVLDQVLHKSRLSDEIFFDGKRTTKDPSKRVWSFIDLGQV